MGTIERLQQLMERVAAYPAWQVALELLVLGAVVWLVVRFVQGTRAAATLKGLLLLIIVATLAVRVFGQRDELQRLQFLYDKFLTVAALGLIVIFQPELRRGLTRLGDTPIFRRSPVGVAKTVEAIGEATAFLAKAKFGAIIVVEREASLKAHYESGTLLHATISARLLQTIFFPGSALHDLAVIVRGGEVLAAGVQLPLAEPDAMADDSLGSRHRAALGISLESDALAIVVSEETGAVSLAENGRLIRHLSRPNLEELLLVKLRAQGRSSPSRRESDRASSRATLPDEPPDEAPHEPA